MPELELNGRLLPFPDRYAPDIGADHGMEADNL